MTPSHRICLTLGIAASLATPFALAAPTVDGTAIVMPDDGWYQVQDAVTYVSLCEGVRRCDVGPGTYLVVNHTTGVRYEKVEVPSFTGTGGAPTVDGSTISWADDGWYQVQDAATYTSLCQGGRSCEVPPGTYRVINLTIGTRYEDIVVEAGSGPGPGPVDGDAFPGRVTADLLVRYDPGATTGLPPGTVSAGDVNGDGREDAIIILRTDVLASPTSAGILFADASNGFPGLPTDPSDPDASATVERAGFVIGGVRSDVTAVGDVNGDGYDDLSFASDGFFELGRGYVLAGGSDPQSVFAGRAADVDAGRTLVETGVVAGFASAGDVNGGQRGATIDLDTVPTLEDVNGDALADLVFEDERIFPGRARDVASIDGPVVRRSPDAFEVRAGSAPPAGTDDYLVEIDGRFAGTLDGTGGSLEVTDPTGGAETRLVLQARDASGTVLGTTRRTVPAYDGPTLEAELVAPRLVRLFVDDLSPPLRSYGRSLVWRDGVPVARTARGGDNWFDTELVLGRTYTYFVTPDYLPTGSLDPSSLADAPLLQRRSNIVTVTLPLP